MSCWWMRVSFVCAKSLMMTWTEAKSFSHFDGFSTHSQSNERWEKMRHWIQMQFLMHDALFFYFFGVWLISEFEMWSYYYFHCLSKEILFASYPSGFDWICQFWLWCWPTKTQCFFHMIHMSKKLALSNSKSQASKMIPGTQKEKKNQNPVQLRFDLISVMECWDHEFLTHGTNF